MPRYYLINRPPEDGAYPDGAIAREIWFPKRPIPVPSSWSFQDWTAHGYVDYNQPLPCKVIEHFELYPDPDDLVSWLIYQYWRDGGHNIQTTRFMIRDAWECAPEFLKDPVDLILLEYKQQGGTLNNLLQALEKQ